MCLIFIWCYEFLGTLKRFVSRGIDYFTQVGIKHGNLNSVLSVLLGQKPHSRDNRARNGAWKSQYVNGIEWLNYAPYHLPSWRLPHYKIIA